MKRKVIKHGNSTLSVSLPNKWVRKYQIKKGDELVIEEKGKTLTVGAGEVRQEGKYALVQFDSPASFNPRDLTKPYLMGFDELRISYADQAVSHLIQEEVSSLLGFEIIMSNAQGCVIKNIAEGVEQEFENILNRLFHILIVSGQELYEGITQNDQEKIRQVIAKEKESNKLSLFCRRMLNLHGYSGDKNVYVLYTLATLLEGAMDEFRFAAAFLLKEKPTPTRKTTDFLYYINTMNKEFYFLYKQFDSKRFSEFRKKRKEMERKFTSFAGLPSADAYLISKLYNVQELVHHMTYF